MSSFVPCTCASVGELLPCTVSQGPLLTGDWPALGLGVTFCPDPEGIPGGGSRANSPETSARPSEEAQCSFNHIVDLNLD